MNCTRFQMAAKNTAGIDLDYVEDSEPERKRIRLQVAETKKRRTRQKQLEPRRETTVTIVARGSSPFSQIPTYPCPVDNNTTGLGCCCFRLIRVTQTLTYIHSVRWCHCRGHPTSYGEHRH
jgi:hypothetical protein